MLRQSLADAEGQQQQQDPSENTSLEPSSSGGGGAAGHDGGGLYGATSETDDGEQESHLQSSFEGDYILDDDDDDDDDDWQQEEQDRSILSRGWQSVKNAFVVIANVENLWDSPDNNHNHHNDYTTASHHHHQQQQQQSRRKNHLVVLFWFVMLALSYTGERSTFKLLVDRAGPFRLFAVEMVTATHAVMLGTIMLIAYCLRRGSSSSSSNSGDYQQQHEHFLPPPQPVHSLSLGVPIVDVGLMALMDTVTILLVFLTGLRVPPTLTVILVQFILPLTAFLTQFVHPDGRCSFNRQAATDTDHDDDDHDRDTNGGGVDDHPEAEADRHHIGGRGGAGEATTLLSSSSAAARDRSNNNTTTSAAAPETTPLTGYGGLARSHVWGSVIIFSAGLLALSPAFYAIADPDFFYYADPIPMRTAINTLLYAVSCIPAAASQLYKEHVFCSYKQPVNMDYLNLLLSVFQFIFASILSPLLFGLQGLGARGDWTTLYPSTDFSENYLDGLKCFFGGLSDDDQENKYPDDARCDLTLLLVLMHALSIIVVGVAVDKIVNAGATNVMYRGISAGIILSVLCMYWYDFMTPDFNYGPAVDALNLFCLVLLILGSEVYHRASLQESTFETEYPMVEPIYLAE